VVYAYRNATETREAWTGVLLDAADVALDRIQVGYGSDGPFLPTEREELKRHLSHMLTAVVMVHDRSRQYGYGSWRNIGWAGHLIRCYDKVIRLMHGYWWGRVTPDESAYDSLVDLLNHAVFTIRAMEESNEKGADFR
jgi:hypothetical protein